MLIEDEKLQLQFKYQLIRSYRIGMKIIPCTNSCWNKISKCKKQLFQSKMGKIWHFIENPETKLKTKSLVTARGHEDNKKQLGCLP